VAKAGKTMNAVKYRSSLRQMSQMVGLLKFAITNSWLPSLAYGGQMLSLQPKDHTLTPAATLWKLIKPDQLDNCSSTCNN